MHYGRAMSERLRQRLIDHLQNASAIRSREVRDAFLEVPREIFIPEVVEAHGMDAAYLDEAFPTKTDDRGDAISSSSQPQIMALMLEESNVGRGDRVLEIGTGTGYNAALLRALVGNQGAVTSVELDPQMAERARQSLTREAGLDVVVGDGRSGYAPGAPFDRILVTARGLGGAARVHTEPNQRESIPDDPRASRRRKANPIGLSRPAARRRSLEARWTD